MNLFGWFKKKTQEEIRAAEYKLLLKALREIDEELDEIYQADIEEAQALLDNAKVLNKRTSDIHSIRQQLVVLQSIE